MATFTSDIAAALACINLNSGEAVCQLSDSKGSTAMFRLRDLPDELQLHVVHFCIPEWSMHLVRWAHHVRKAEEGVHKQELRYVSRRSTMFQPSLYLVDAHMTAQVREAAKSRFTGQLYTEYLATESKSWKLNSDCTCLSLVNRIHAKKDILSSILDHITTVNCWISGFMNFDRDLLQVLPNLQAVVARYRKRLFDGYIYGFGSEQLLIQHISEDAITSLFMPQVSSSAQMQTLLRLWAADIAAIIELQVDVGRSTMSFSFMAICCVVQASDSQISIKILRRYSMRQREQLDDRSKTKLYSLNTTV